MSHHIVFQWKTTYSAFIQIDKIKIFLWWHSIPDKFWKSFTSVFTLFHWLRLPRTFLAFSIHDSNMIGRNLFSKKFLHSLIFQKKDTRLALVVRPLISSLVISRKIRMTIIILRQNTIALFMYISKTEFMGNSF